MLNSNSNIYSLFKSRALVQFCGTKLDYFLFMQLCPSITYVCGSGGRVVID